MFGKLFGSSSDSNKSSSSLAIRKELVVLLILDGFGVHPDPVGNAVLQAQTPFLDTIWTKSHSTLLHASGVHVGLPEFENGNSEVGHLNLGSGQIVYQSLPRINDAIKNGTFHQNKVIQDGIKHAKENGTDFHLMGILSDGGVHGHIEHLYALMQLCKDFEIDPILHLFLDGRDTGLTEGHRYTKEVMERIAQIGVGRIGSISGRFYAMDRDKRWERTQLAYDAIRGFSDNKATDPLEAIKQAYKDDENDQILTPITMVNSDSVPVGAVKDSDVVLFYNFREDRARQLSRAFVLPDTTKIVQKEPLDKVHFITMTGYEDSLPTKVVFPPKKIEESLAKAISSSKRKQLHISETEKYMHVTYFFNGGIEDPHPGEDFFNIPSPKVFDYAETPAMSAEIIRDEVVYRLERQKEFGYSFVVINLANPDMLGHTGNLQQTIKANEIIDRCSKDIVSATVKAGGCAMVIADHGNCETMINRDDSSVNTYHTNSPVPIVIVNSEDQLSADPDEEVKKIGTGEDVAISGILADIAPTVLSILDVPKPSSMTGINLLEVIK